VYKDIVYNNYNLIFSQLFTTYLFAGTFLNNIQRRAVSLWQLSFLCFEY